MHFVISPPPPPVGGAGIPSVRQAAYTSLQTEGPILPATDPATTAVGPAPTAGFSYLYIMLNTSTGGQKIRVGTAPTFVGSGSGFLLQVGDGLTLPGIAGTTWLATCDLAGGRLELIVMRG